MKLNYSLEGCRTREELCYIAREYEEEMLEMVKKEVMTVIEYAECVGDIRRQVKQKLLTLNN